jgi:hypothetical protein
MISLVRDLIWIAIFFVGTLIVLLLLRPVWILQRDYVTGRIVNDISGGKLFGWAILITFILTLIYYVFTLYRGRRCNGSDILL